MSPVWTFHLVRRPWWRRRWSGEYEIEVGDLVEHRHRVTVRLRAWTEKGARRRALRAYEQGQTWSDF